MSLVVFRRCALFALFWFSVWGWKWFDALALLCCRPRLPMLYPIGERVRRPRQISYATVVLLGSFFGHFGIGW